MSYIIQLEIIKIKSLNSLSLANNQVELLSNSCSDEHARS